jgi:hypothetical protein
MITDEFDFERTVRKWTIEFYKQKGFDVKEITGKENRNFDLILSKDGKSYNVEEKALRKMYDVPSFIFEIVQDVKTKNWGWIYDCHADYIFYIFWGENRPIFIYKIIWEKVFHYILGKLDKYPLRISKKGFGLTIFSVIPFQELVSENLAQTIYNDVDEIANKGWDNG